MSHQHITPIAPRDLVKQLRTLVPLRPLTLSESYTLAERQASQALDLVGITEPGLTVSWLLDLPRVEVRLAPRHRMDRLSGMTTFSHGRYLILINQNDAHARRRFTLAHEFKHLLDYTAAKLIHANLGHGDLSRQSRQVELVADHFAACLLMPKILVRRGWTSGIQDPVALAGLFNVSADAMRVRLRYLGYLTDTARPIKTYFRREPQFRVAT
jgi:hypothetical protein